MGLFSRKLSGILLKFSIGFTSIHAFLLFSLSITFLFSFDWLTYPLELADLTNSVIIFLSQTTLRRWLAFLLGLLTVSLTVSLLRIYFFLIMFLFQFPLTFYQTQKEMTHSLRLLSLWLGRSSWSFEICSMGRCLFKLDAFATGTKFCKWVQVEIDVCNPYCKYHVKPHSPRWFLAVCDAAIVHRNIFFSLVLTE